MQDSVAVTLSASRDCLHVRVSLHALIVLGEVISTRVFNQGAAFVTGYAHTLYAAWDAGEVARVVGGCVVGAV